MGKKFTVYRKLRGDIGFSDKYLDPYRGIGILIKPTEG
jgi:hypothetical protein